MGSAKADLLLVRARVLTLDSRDSRAEWVAIKEGKILRVGRGNDCSQLQGPATRVLDGEGKAVIPGLHDAHLHLLALAADYLSLDCSPASVSSIAEIKAALRREAAQVPPGTWIRARGYNEFYLAEKRHPNRWDLDEAAPHHPVQLIHRSRHAAVLNSLALARAGVTAESSDPEGGLIDRDLATGQPTGLLFGMNDYLSAKVVPPLPEEALTRGVARVVKECLSFGITSLQEATATNDWKQWQFFQRLKSRGLLPLNLTVMVGWPALGEFLERGLSFGAGETGLRLGAVKIVLERTTGRLCPSPEELAEAVGRAQAAGFQVALHAVEKETVAAVATCLEQAAAWARPKNLRHRVEHCSVAPPALLQRLHKAKALVVTQPSFVYYSGERYRAEVPPEEQRWLYPLRSLYQAGLRPAAGSDAPVVPLNPWPSLYAAVTRRAADGQPLIPEEALTPAQALAMYTRNAAYSGFQEQQRGSLVPGKDADLAILSDDPLGEAEALLQIGVEKTIIGGRVIWEG